MCVIGKSKASRNNKAEAKTMDYIEIPNSGYIVQHLADGSRVLLAEPVDFILIRTLQELQAPVIEMWALWRRSVGDVTLLKELSHLKRLHVINRTTDQIGGLAELKQLQALSIETGRKFDVDVRSWPVLEDLLFFWSGKFTGLADARSLRRLSIWRWREPDLQRLIEAPQLRELTLVKGGLRTLSGIEACTGLEALALSHLTRLDDFHDIGKLRRLRSLSIDTCRNVREIDWVSSLSNLESLYLYNIGNVNSLAPVKTLGTLKRLHFGGSTNVLDGNSIIVKELGLSEYGFTNRKHYNYTYDHVGGPIENL